MLKLLRGQTPAGDIDWTNKVFTFDKIIGNILIAYVDWEEVKWYSFDWVTITFDEAPTASILVDYFYREVNCIVWEWDVTLWDLKLAFYRKIWRVNWDGTVPNNINKLYPEDYVKLQLRKSFKRIVNKSPEKTKIQQYAFLTTNGYTVTSVNSDNTISLAESFEQGISGMFFIWQGVAYDYYSISDWVYQVKWPDISKIGDRVIVWNRIPYGVKKISSITVDGLPLDYLDERDFTMGSIWHYTIVRDWQGNKYILLPYKARQQTTIVKFIAEEWTMSDEDDIIDIPEEYSDVIVYDTAYRMLMEKEDERWAWFKQELWNWKREWLLFEYQSYVRSENKLSRARIWIAKTWKDYQY